MMRVMTYNIHGWRTTGGRPNLAAVIETVRRADPHILGLNEVFHPAAVADPQVAGAGMGNVAALEMLAKELNMAYLFGPCLRWPAQDEMPANAYGNALLSKYPIMAGAAHHLTAVEGKEQRGLLEGRVQLPDGKSFTIYVTHLDHTSEAARLTQLRALRSWTIRDRNRAHVVMGDFNAISLWDFAGREEAWQGLSHHPKGSNLGGDGAGPQVVAQMEKAGYIDTYAHVGRPGQQSFIPATDPPIRIDYIFASAPLLPALVDCTIVVEPPDSEASDHRPVLATFDPTQLT
ncbi:MAG: endonuclease/exonuclease/phosphatase family protein [Litorilinea sp.]